MTFLLDHALALGADHMATGHYVRLRKKEAGYQLLRAVDKNKDQSYVLHVLSQEKLSRALFPVGDYAKPEIRQIAEKYGLPTASRKDSQDLCFLAGEDYRGFLQRNAADFLVPGKIVTRAGVPVGGHNGLANYTIGQRKGLGLASPVPLYVLAKNAITNTLMVGTQEELGSSDLTAFSLFIQDKWRITPKVTLNYGLRWDAQLMPETVDPKTTAYAAFLNDPNFPSDGTIPDQWKQFQPRLGVAWDVKGDGKSVLRANGGIYYARQNMLTQVGSVTTNGLQQQTLYRNSTFTSFADMPAWPSLLTPTPVPPGTFPLFTGVRVFAKDYRNPRIYSATVAYEQELAPGWSAYVDFTWAKGVYLTQSLNYNNPSRGGPYYLQLDETFVATSRANGLS